jgi:hypothetical protein
MGATGDITVQLACNRVQGATATLASTATVALWNL